MDNPTILLMKSSSVILFNRMGLAVLQTAMLVDTDKTKKPNYYIAIRTKLVIKNKKYRWSELN